MKPAAFLCAVICALAVTAPSFAGDKKGIAIGQKDAGAAGTIQRLNARWYYTWNAEPIAQAGSAQFVPMIWSDGATMDREATQLGQESKPCALLAFNEPDGKRQADMSVDEAVGAWDRLRPLARRIGSPAAVNALGPWFKDFSARMAAQGKDYDFVAVHWYGAPSAKSFLRKIDDIHAAYGKPIWITEFAVSDWAARDGRKSRYSTAATERFMRTVLPELERRPYVERYAWMGAGAYREATISSRLVDDSGGLTALGRIYAEFDGDAAGSVTDEPACAAGE
ncbi:glycosyl hydrolase [Inquilinus limosus]|uniref:glycosyl hydrolase n=1 Tax=Inquilinus limosus TaxID=171674 RepID=UPI00068EBE82|nr:glycosyl hydrolase [Inquilinus limosus]